MLKDEIICNHTETNIPCLSCGQLSNPLPVIDYNHLWLYARGHYVRNDLIEDLQKIFMARSGTELKFNPITIVSIILEQVLPHLNTRVVIEVVEVALGFKVRKLYRGFTEEQIQKIYTIEVIEFLLGQMSAIAIYTDDREPLVNEGRPDSNILELKRPVSWVINSE
jgi:hypothetical protein